MSQGLKSHVVFEALGMKGLLTYVGLYVAHKELVSCQSLFVELNINFFSLILSCGLTFQKLACYAFSDLYFNTVLAWLWALVSFPGVSSSRTPIHWSILNLSMCALKSSTSPVRHTHHHLNNKQLFKFRVELQLFWKLTPEKGVVLTLTSTIWLLAHFSPPVCAHAQGEVHYRCTTVSQEGFLLSLSNLTEELPVPFCTFLRPGSEEEKLKEHWITVERHLAGPHHQWRYLSTCTLPFMQASLQALEMFYVQKKKKLFWVQNESYEEQKVCTLWRW